MPKQCMCLYTRVSVHTHSCVKEDFPPSLRQELAKSLSRPCWAGIHDPPVSASQSIGITVMELSATTPGLKLRDFINYFL